ncbi:MAG: tyrosine-type recombinase/integrase [Deltaproteobacteria bacterium]|nr:tyrosine-type recombinase/integrase [Deltaproteobacteria bacterium]MBW2445360.1 tyrosine-type recombinase/integrase [Deltaproteobacteria bacterium]
MPEAFEPGPEVLVLGELDASNFRAREWRRIAKRAGVGLRRPKDLRDTFASQLLTLGVPLTYISRQLGHRQVATTEKHYARYQGDEYVDPLRREPWEVPADFLARTFAEQSGHEFDHSGVLGNRGDAQPRERNGGAEGDRTPAPQTARSREAQEITGAYAQWPASSGEGRHMAAPIAAPGSIRLWLMGAPHPPGRVVTPPPDRPQEANEPGRGPAA